MKRYPRGTPHPQHDVPSNGCYAKGCGAEACLDEHRLYERERYRIRHRPDSDWADKMVPVDEARRHLAFIDKVVPPRRRAKLVGVNPVTLWRIRNGEVKRIKQSTERKILAVVRDPDYMPTRAVREHLRFLQSRGVGVIRLSERTGIQHYFLIQLRRGDHEFIPRSTAEKILACKPEQFTWNRAAARAHRSWEIAS